MCILFISTDPNPAPGCYKLILASNRDEFYHRPALSLAEWTENKSVFGGRDMEKCREGGTWLAMSVNESVFRLGALLNITGEKKSPNALPRGNLVADYVTGSMPNEEYCRSLVDSGIEHNGYNLVTVEISENDIHVIHCSNVDEHIKEWPKGRILGFGNSPPRTPLEKVKNGRVLFKEHINRGHSKGDLVENLMELLQNKQKCWPDDELYRRAPELAEKLCCIGVHIPEVHYGSRTRSVILVDADNNVDFFEETQLSDDPAGKWKQTHLHTKIL